MKHNYRIIAFYKFVPLPDYHDLRTALLAFSREHGIKGSILLAAEGINGTVASEPDNIELLITRLRADSRFADMIFKESAAEFNPFRRMKVRLKKEIVALGVEGIDPLERVGTYVPPQEWNNVISQPDVIVIDTRNSYEFEVGTFAGAEDPHTESFREFPAYVEQRFGADRPKVAMFCTGGIRCEKATTFMLDQGFEEVYHLQGGILNYLQIVEPEQSLWQGECFVFDDRTTVDHHLQPGQTVICGICQVKLDAADLASPQYERGVVCPHCFETTTPEQMDSRRERIRHTQS
jgi:UPF0176 protein